jgi:mono/diheme cytochrome c family protein
VRKHIFVISPLILFSALAITQQSQPEFKPTPPAAITVPAEDARVANPVKPTPESIASGKKYFGYDCAMCHGETGDGKGEVALSDKLDLKDFRDPESLKNRTDGELFYILKKGHGHMPPEQIRQSPNELWNLVNYVRSLAPKSDKK